MDTKKTMHRKNNMEQKKKKRKSDSFVRAEFRL